MTTTTINAPVKRSLRMLRSVEAVVVYRGPSAINGAPIVAVITGIANPSRNPKTGPMAQLWILAADEAPHLAVKTGADEAVCGDCPMRPSVAKKGQACYVATYQAPRSVWQSRRDMPVDLELAVDAIRGKALRLGAYGDPAAIPESSGVIQALSAAASMRTGYTHQWRQGYAQWLRGYVMASLDAGTTAEQLAACHANGWRSFRAEVSAECYPGEIVCPATTESEAQCIDCGLCDGWRGEHNAKQPRSIVIAIH